MKVLRRKARVLRRKGLSYSEISSSIGVSKSTLSGWLNGLKLCAQARERLNLLQYEGRKKGALIRKKKVEKNIKEYDEEALKKISRVSDRELLLLGAALYWCEGAKQTARNKSVPVKFGNTDVLMIKMFLIWLDKSLNVKISPKNVNLTLYIHPGADERSILAYWMNKVGLGKDYFRKPVYKKNRLDQKRKSDYHGLVRVEVARSADLNRRISAIYKAVSSRVINKCGIV
ncbi:hypothetical protein MUP65_02695 [Patescibacteria group bacterium]|nr:hypothetical protein [Patescibacteria group bacterium]